MAIKKQAWYMKYALFPLKVISALLVAAFISLVGKALLHYGYFSFMFLFLTVFFAFFKLVRKLSFMGILFVDWIFILMVVLVKLYIVIADKS